VSEHREAAAPSVLAWVVFTALLLGGAGVAWLASRPAPPVDAPWMRIQTLHEVLARTAAEGRWSTPVATKLDGELWVSQARRVRGAPYSLHVRAVPFPTPADAAAFPGPPEGLLAFDLLEDTVVTGSAPGAFWALVGSGGTDALRSALSSLPPLNPPQPPDGGGTTSATRQ
jgi:hypothetical protein